MAARQFDDVRAAGRMRLVYFRHFPFFLSSFPFSVESARTVGDMFRPPPARKSHITSGESSSWSASDLIRSVPVAFRNRRKILFDFLACSPNRRSARQCHFHTFSLSMLAVCCLYCSFGQSQVVLVDIHNSPTSRYFTRSILFWERTRLVECSCWRYIANPHRCLS